MSRLISGALGAAQRSLGSMSAAVWLARKIRNQCDAVVHAALQDGPDAERNGEARLVEALVPDEIRVIDVGAHRGGWSALLFARPRRVGRLLLVEPDPRWATELTARYAGQAGVEIVQAAAGSSPGSAVMYFEPGATESSSIVPGVSLPGAAPQEVRIVTVDDEAERLGFDEVQLLKLDCEGYDLHALRGAQRLLGRRAAWAVQFEYNTGWALAGSTLADALRLLGDAGYRTYLLRRSGLQPYDYARDGEFFKYANFVGLRPDVEARLGALIQR